MRTTFRRLLPLCACLVAVGPFAAAGAAQQSPPLTFSEEKVTTTCQDLVTGEELTVVNATAIEQSLNLILSPSAETGGILTSACGGLSFATVPKTVPPGDTVTVKLQAASGSDPKEALEGAIVTFASAGLASRLPLTINLSSDAGTPTPLLDSVSGTQYLGNREDDTPLYIPVDLGEKSAAPFAAGEIVGAVSGANDRAAVTYVETKMIDGVPMVGLDADALDAGEYKGSADLLPDSDEGDVSLSLTVKDSWGWALAALALGFLIAFLAQWASGVFGPRRKLKSKAGGIAQTYITALSALEHAPGSGKWKASTISDLDSKIDALKADIDTKTEGAYVSIDQKVIDALEATIAAADVVVTGFGSLARQLPTLEDGLRALADRPEPLPPLVGIPAGQTEPTLARLAREHLSKKEFLFEQLAEELPAISRARDNVDLLHRLEQYMSVLYRNATALKDWWSDHGDATKADAAEVLIDELRGIRHQLWETDQTDQPLEFRKRLRTLDDAMSLLWPQEVERIAPYEGLPESRIERDRLEVLLDGLSGGGIDRFRSQDDVYVVIDQAQDDAATARWVERGALVLGLALAIVAGMQALYIGKPFGSNWDYLVAVTWGLATPTALAVAWATLNRIGALTALKGRTG